MIVSDPKLISQHQKFSLLMQYSFTAKWVENLAKWEKKISDPYIGVKPV